MSNKELVSRKHADAQKKHNLKKQQSASRKCVWVPKGKESEFQQAIIALQQKWNAK